MPEPVNKLPFKLKIELYLRIKLHNLLTKAINWLERHGYGSK